MRQTHYDWLIFSLSCGISGIVNSPGQSTQQANQFALPAGLRLRHHPSQQVAHRKDAASACGGDRGQLVASQQLPCQFGLGARQAEQCGQHGGINRFFEGRIGNAQNDRGLIGEEKILQTPDRYGHHNQRRFAGWSGETQRAPLAGAACRRADQRLQGTGRGRRRVRQRLSPASRPSAVRNSRSVARLA